MSNFITSNSDYGIKCIGFIGKYNELLFHHVVEGAIDEAEVQDGGSGAFYIYMKKKL